MHPTTQHSRFPCHIATLSLVHSHRPYPIYKVTKFHSSHKFTRLLDNPQSSHSPPTAIPGTMSDAFHRVCYETFVGIERMHDMIRVEIVAASWQWEAA